MGWIRRLRTTLRPSPLDSALDDELRFHIERPIGLIAEGMTYGARNSFRRCLSRRSYAPAASSHLV